MYMCRNSFQFFGSNKFIMGSTSSPGTNIMASTSYYWDIAHGYQHFCIQTAHAVSHFQSATWKLHSSQFNSYSEPWCWKDSLNMECVNEMDFSTLSWTSCHRGLSSSQWQKERLNYFVEMRPALHLIHLCVTSTGHSAWHTVGTQDISVIWMSEEMAHIHLSHFLKYSLEYPNLLCVVTGRQVSESCPVHMCMY